MGKFGAGFLFLIALAVIALVNSFFIVDQREQAVVFQVGRVVNVHNAPREGEVFGNEAGLKFKIPFVQNVSKFDRRNLGFDMPDIEVVASNQELLNVDAFIRWRIIDPLEFFRKVRSERAARGQLRTFADAAIREVLGKRKPNEIVSLDRRVLMEQIRSKLDEDTRRFGISIIDVRIRRADLPLDVSERVYDQMRATRQQQAELLRAEGDREAARIRAEADRDKVVRLAEANKYSQQTQGEGDALRNEIYANAYGQDAEFFRFQRALIACEKAFKSGTRIVVSPDNLGLCDEFIDLARQNGTAGR